MNADLTKSKACLKYGYAKLALVLGKSKDVRSTADFTTFFRDVIGGLVSAGPREELNLLVPNNIRPLSEIIVESSAEIDYFERTVKETNNLVAANNQKSVKKNRILMSSKSKKKGSAPTKESTPKLKWHILISQSMKDGIDLDSYRNTGIKS